MGFGKFKFLINVSFYWGIIMFFGGWIVMDKSESREFS